MSSWLTVNWYLVTLKGTESLISLVFYAHLLTKIMYTRPGADVINKLLSSIATLCWNKAPWLVQNSQRTWNIQSEFMTAAPGIFNFFVSVYFYKTGAKVTTKLSSVTILHWIKALSMDDVISHSTITNQSQCVICTLCWCAITKVVYDIDSRFSSQEVVFLATKLRQTFDDILNGRSISQQNVLFQNLFGGNTIKDFVKKPTLA